MRPRSEGCVQGLARARRWIPRALLAACGTCLMLAGLIAGAGRAGASAREAFVLDLDGPISPAVATYVTRGLAAAAERGAEVAIIHLDTPGGLASSMRTIVKAMLNAELETFAYSVAHDLRTPLRSIHGFATVLEEEHADTLGESGHQHLKRIQSAAGRMGRLITDLLSMSQLSRATLRVAPVNISDMAREITAELQRTAPQRRVVWQIEPGLRAEADPVLVRAVLQNLLGNAWKYTGQTADARISLTCESTRDGMHTFCVRDNGAGFDMAYVAQLFQPFKRLHASDEFEGSGVGLATVRRIVERHGGSVSGEGAVAQGAVFRFSLPQAATP